MLRMLALRMWVVAVTGIAMAVLVSVGTPDRVPGALAATCNKLAFPNPVQPLIDGARPDAGPVAKPSFDHAIPLLFHGVCAP